MEVSGLEEDQSAAMKLMAAEVPVPEDEAESLFAAPVEEKAGNIIEADVQPPQDKEAEPGKASELVIEAATDEISGNVASDPQSVGEQVVEQEEVNGNTVINDPENS